MKKVLPRTLRAVRNLTIGAAATMMEEKRLLYLPVTQNGRVADSVTRHDILRAWIGFGTTGED